MGRTFNLITDRERPLEECFQAISDGVPPGMIYALPMVHPVFGPNPPATRMEPCSPPQKIRLRAADSPGYHPLRPDDALRRLTKESDFNSETKRSIEELEKRLDKLDADRARNLKEIQLSARSALEKLKKRLEMILLKLKKWDGSTQKHFKKMFGNDDEHSRNLIDDRTRKMLAHTSKLLERSDEHLELTKRPTKSPPMSDEEYLDELRGYESTFAYVYPADDRKIYLGPKFENSPAEGEDSQIGTLAHEMSHFKSISGTTDERYGRTNSESLAKTDPDKALRNADNYEYFVELIPEDDGHGDSDTKSSIVRPILP
jgi:hypothetical protein